jgi:hypothetical protein
VGNPPRWPRDTPLSAKVSTIFRRQVAVAKSVQFACGLRATEFGCFEEHQQNNVSWQQPLGSRAAHLLSCPEDIHTWQNGLDARLVSDQDRLWSVTCTATGTRTMNPTTTVPRCLQLCVTQKPRTFAMIAPSGNWFHSQGVPVGCTREHSGCTCALTMWSAPIWTLLPLVSPLTDAERTVH